MGSRTKRASTEDAAPTAEAIAEATSDVPPPSTEMTDQQIADFLRAAQAERAAAAPPAAPRKTISDVYTELVGLVASASSPPNRTFVRVSENTAVKVLELTLGWALQNRAQSGPATDIFPAEMVGGGSDGSEESNDPIPNEIIEAAPEAAEGE